MVFVEQPLASPGSVKYLKHGDVKTQVMTNITYKKIYCVPEGGLKPPIFGLGDRRLIHWAIGL